MSETNFMNMFSGLPPAPLIQYYSSLGIFAIPRPSISVESLETVFASTVLNVSGIPLTFYMYNWVGHGFSKSSSGDTALQK